MDTGVYQRLGHVFHAFARLAIHDAGVALVLALDEAQQLLHGLALLHNRVADVGPIETTDKGPRLLQLQALQNVVLGQRVGRGGQRHAWHTGKALVQHRQRPVFGTEVVAPLADAMRFVYGKQTQVVAVIQRVQQRQKPGVGDALGCRIQQRDVAAQHALLNLVGLFTAQRRVQKGGADTGLV